MKISLESIVLAVLNPSDLGNEILKQGAEEIDKLSPPAKQMCFERLQEITVEMCQKGEV